MTAMFYLNKQDKAGSSSHSVSTVECLPISGHLLNSCSPSKGSQFTGRQPQQEICDQSRVVSKGRDDRFIFLKWSFLSVPPERTQNVIHSALEDDRAQDLPPKYF